MVAGMDLIDEVDRRMGEQTYFPQKEARIYASLASSGKLIEDSKLINP